MSILAVIFGTTIAIAFRATVSEGVTVLAAIFRFPVIFCVLVSEVQVRKPVMG